MFLFCFVLFCIVCTKIFSTFGKLIIQSDILFFQIFFYSEYYGISVDTYDSKTGLILKAVFEESEYGRNLAKRNNIKNFERSFTDDINNTYHCLRMIDHNRMKNGIIFCSFQCTHPGKKGKKEEVELRKIIPCPTNQAEGKGEYYDLDKDPWNYNNLWDTLDDKTIRQYLSVIEKFHHCKGQKECNSMRFGDLNTHSNGQTIVKRQSNYTFSILTNNYDYLDVSESQQKLLRGGNNLFDKLVNK